MLINDLKIAIKACVNERLPMAIWGPSGAGKSAIGREAAKELGEEFELGDDYHYVDVRLSQFEPTDLRGIMVPDLKKRQSVWLPPSMMPQDPDWTGIIMFDEISSALPMVQAAAYQLFLDRRIGEYELPEGASIIAAGNRLSDKGVVFPMASPLANRFATHLELELSLTEWKKWAYRENIHPIVLGFLSANEHMLHKFDPASKEKGFASPRTWEYVSKMLYMGAVPEHIVKEMIQGGIGSGAGIDLWDYKELQNGVVATETIFDLQAEYELPQESTVFYSINSSIIHYVKNKPKWTEAMGLAIYRYLQKIPAEEVRVASFKEFTGAKLEIVGSKFAKVKQAFDEFFEPVKHLIPQT
jgi:hypothetical protein